MKTKKILSRIFLGIFCVSGISATALTLTSCQDTKTNVTTEYTVTFNTQGGSNVGSIKVSDGQKATKPANPSRDGYIFKYWSLEANGAEYNFDTAVTGNLTLYAVWEKEQETVTTYTVTFVTGEGASTVAPATVNANEKVTLPAEPTKDGYNFLYWSTSEGGSEFNFDTPITANTTLYAVWEEKVYETVTRTLDLSTAPSCMEGPDASGYYIGEGTDGYFSFYGQKIRWEQNNLAINTQGTAAVKNCAIGFTTTSAGELTFSVKGASGSNIGIVLLDAEGNIVAETPISNSEEKSGTFAIPAAGTYYFGSKASSIRIYGLSYTEQVEQSDPSGIEIVTPGTNDFLVGDEFNSNGLNINLVYENGRTDIIEGVVTPLTAEQMSTAGQYDVKVSYTLDGKTYDTSYKVNVYGLDSIQYLDYDYDGDKTLIIQKVFLVGDKFNSNNLVVVANGKLTVGDQVLEHQFILDAADYSVSTPDMSQAGEKEITVTSTLDSTKTTSYIINVVNDVVTDKNANITIYVTANGEVSVAANSINFASINDALKYLELVGVADDAIKTLDLSAGTFHEKVEITLPNVHLVGETTVTPNLNEQQYLVDTTVNDKTIITYGAYNGLTVPSGVGTYSTDGSATVSIRESAVGFSATGISFANDINTLEEYNELKAKTSGTQAVAVLVQADQSFFSQCSFSGYQDTLYAQVGRQIYTACYIEGRTDYIFGYDATALFSGVEIHSFGADNDAKNGGYVVATKGSSSLNYGYVFANVAFTAASDVTPGTVSLARGWDAYMTMAVIHSNIGGHISKEAYGEATAGSDQNKNDRYGAMNSNGVPVPARLVENGNIGDGAITESLADTCTVLSDTDAVAYTNLVTIFGKDTNGTSYDCDWTGDLVTYDATINYYDGTEVINTQKDYVGTTLDKLYVAPAKENQTFVGWYTTPTFDEGTEYDMSSKLTATTSLYGKWEASSGEVLHTYSLEAAALFTELGLTGTSNLKEPTVYGEVFTFSAGMRIKADCFSNNKTQSVYGSNAYIEFDVKGTGSINIEISSSGRPVYIYSVVDGALGELVTSFSDSTVTDLEQGKYVIMFNADGETPNIEPKITKIELKDTF